MLLAHKIIAAKVVITGVVLVTAGTVLTAAALADPKCRDKLKEYAEVSQWYEEHMNQMLS